MVTLLGTPCMFYVPDLTMHLINFISFKTIPPIRTIYRYIYLYFTKNMVVSDRLGETNKQTTKQIHRQINK